jgi:hypothetical protein
MRSGKQGRKWDHALTDENRDQIFLLYKECDGENITLLVPQKPQKLAGNSKARLGDLLA